MNEWLAGVGLVLAVVGVLGAGFGLAALLVTSIGDRRAQR